MTKRKKKKQEIYLLNAEIVNDSASSSGQNTG